MAQKVTSPREFAQSVQELASMVPKDVREHAWNLLIESVAWVETQADLDTRKRWAKKLREFELEDPMGRNFYTGTGMIFAADLLDPDIEDPK
ncbi:hypothetical protein SEA_DANZINA_63 [Streptomyces phage Danzina]|uniref:Uncharacterized protein n=1 Tax=Streptomyces phage Danzina TaxID=1690427 RepID=A0A0K1Y9D2_9CAUD|nr:hypothetical protein FDG70_gp63 [Streptomyces phage Danzina]AKY03518.1 hypothetical protein SEA_DANZINA_63 [Streptomyces phage Danzina]